VQVAALYCGPAAMPDWPMYGPQLLEDALAALGARRGLKPDEWPPADVGSTFGAPSADLCASPRTHMSHTLTAGAGDHCHIASGPRLYAEPSTPHRTHTRTH
jgi:hypothetical protein